MLQAMLERHEKEQSLMHEEEEDGREEDYWMMQEYMLQEMLTSHNQIMLKVEEYIHLFQFDLVSLHLSDLVLVYLEKEELRIRKVELILYLLLYLHTSSQPVKIL